MKKMVNGQSSMVRRRWLAGLLGLSVLLARLVYGSSIFIGGGGTGGSGGAITGSVGIASADETIDVTQDGTNFDLGVSDAFVASNDAEFVSRGANLITNPPTFQNTNATGAEASLMEFLGTAVTGGRVVRLVRQDNTHCLYLVFSTITAGVTNDLYCLGLDCTGTDDMVLSYVYGIGDVIRGNTNSNVMIGRGIGAPGFGAQVTIQGGSGTLSVPALALLESAGGTNAPQLWFYSADSNSRWSQVRWGNNRWLTGTDWNDDGGYDYYFAPVGGQPTFNLTYTSVVANVLLLADNANIGTLTAAHQTTLNGLVIPTGNLVTSNLLTLGSGSLSWSAAVVTNNVFSGTLGGVTNMFVVFDASAGSLSNVIRVNTGRQVVLVRVDATTNSCILDANGSGTARKWDLTGTGYLDLPCSNSVVAIGYNNIWRTIGGNFSVAAAQATADTASNLAASVATQIGRTNLAVFTTDANGAVTLYSGTFTNVFTGWLVFSNVDEVDWESPWMAKVNAVISNRIDYSLAYSSGQAANKTVSNAWWLTVASP